MMASPALTPARRLVLYGLCAALLSVVVGCDALGIGGEDEPAPPRVREIDARPFEVAILQYAPSDTSDEPVERVLGDYDLPWRALPLELARRVPMAYEEDVGLRWAGETDTDVVLFAVWRPEEPGEHVRASVLSPGHTVTLRGMPPFQGAVYLFFVDGIGEQPREPFDVQVAPEANFGEARRVEVDPERHVLPDSLALKVSHQDLQRPLAHPQSTTLSLINPVYFEHMEAPREQLPFWPIVVHRHTIFQASAFPYDTDSFGIHFTGSAARLPEDFELYVFMLDLYREN